MSLPFKPSILLTTEENNLIFSLLGTGCSSFATTVVERYVANGKSKMNKWILADVGVLCFVKDRNHRSFFFRLYCPNLKKLIWEHELYNFMEYLKLTEYLHSFESEDCITGFNFANEDEADMFYDSVNSKLKIPKISRNPSKASKTVKTTPEIKTTNTDVSPKLDFSFNRRTMQNKKNKKKITKDLIGAPQDFRHITHFGFDNTPDLDKIDDFFNQAGVSEIQLQDPKTRQFIIDFINKNGGMEAVKSEVDISAPRTKRYQYDTVETSQSPPLSPLRVMTDPPSLYFSEFYVPTPALKHPSDIPPPPPSRPNIPIPQPPPLIQQDDPRSNLMEAIKSGRTLKHVSSLNDGNNTRTMDEINPENAGRHNLLDEIRHGVKLHAVPKVDEHDRKPAPIRGGLAAALADALNQRAMAIQNNSEESSSESSDYEEWNDD